jgi:diguanylate cyclase (GGDEF)-like protein
MDFIDWCHHILRTLENERFSQHLSDYELQDLLYGENGRQPDFHTSDTRQGMFQALETLSTVGLAEETNYSWRITPFGRKVLSDPTEYWAEICVEDLDEDEEKLLCLVNELSPQQETNPDSAWLKEIGSQPILEAFNIEPPPAQSNEHMDDLQKYIYGLPELLGQRGFLKTDGRAGYYNDVRPTYSGLVWSTRREVTKLQLLRQSVSKFGVPDHNAFKVTLETVSSDEVFVSVVFIDLDNFKSVNDKFNHQVGDHVIEEALSLVRRVIRGKGEVFHRSGDEMLLLLVNFSEAEAYAVCERIRRDIENHEFPEIGKGFVTASLGIATYPIHSKDLADLENAADEAAMGAKNQKNTVKLASN